jgi:hypothetical protein
VEVTWPGPGEPSALEQEGGGEVAGSTWILQVQAEGGSDVAGSRLPLRARVGGWEVELVVTWLGLRAGSGGGGVAMRWPGPYALERESGG